MAIKNIHTVKSFDLFNFRNTVRTGWSSFRNITLCSTLRKASLKRSDKPYHKSYISKSSAANCIKEDNIRRGGVRIDRRQSECDRAAERLRICNRALDEYYIKRQEYQNQFYKSIKGRVPVLTRKLKEIMTQAYSPVRSSSTMQLPNLTSSQLSNHSQHSSVRAEKPDCIRQYLPQDDPAASRATNSESNLHDSDIDLLDREREGERKVWQLGSRLIPCLDA